MTDLEKLARQVSVRLSGVEVAIPATKSISGFLTMVAKEKVKNRGSLKSYRGLKMVRVLNEKEAEQEVINLATDWLVYARLSKGSDGSLESVLKVLANYVEV